ncbi:MAG: primosomal protein N' [Candidatus Omnitrophica bacterium]|nr:primosomal protein N' [Candidatus Omnitrophota bacterium]
MKTATAPKLYAKILLKLPIDTPFDYEVPKRFENEVAVGKRVWVNFGPRKLIGYVVGTSSTTDVEKTRPILGLIDSELILNDEILKLTKEISEYYLCSWGEAIDAAVPSSLKRGKTSVKSRVKDEHESITPSTHLKPTEEQEKALRSIYKTIDEDKYQTFLLHGITGSGKTEVYLQAIGKILEKGGSCIVLVPEISLTPQAVERFKSRFQERVALFHSRLTAGQKYREWKKLKDGICHIVVGARSAIFSPIKNLGLIIVDEEHDTSYKQQDAPRYNAVDVAIMRAKLNNAVVILGSATPSLESSYKGKNKEYKLLQLQERIEKRPLPKVRILDMRQELIERRRRRIIFSRLLTESIEKVLDRNQQTILFLNRRGFSTYANCKKCGYVERCKKCNVALNYHSDKEKLVCHYCNYQKEPVDICPSCKGSYIDFFGFGTQRVESELHKHFPSSTISRMDTDATRKRLSHNLILKDFSSGKTQILVGTQMIAKGHDFPGVTLVGVVSADTALNLPDFRAGERTFQLLTQVAGRAGRGFSPGEVIIQTYVPHHYTINSAINHDYTAFYKKEIALRRELMLPPFSHMVYITSRSYKEERAQKCAEDLARHILKRPLSNMIELSGPCKDFVYRLRRQFRWNIILKVKDLKEFNPRLRKRLKEFKKPHGVILTVDVDPA